jgi:hypothetical protein
MRDLPSCMSASLDAKQKIHGRRHMSGLQTITKMKSKRSVILEDVISLLTLRQKKTYYQNLNLIYIEDTIFIKNSI